MSDDSWLALPGEVEKASPRIRAGKKLKNEKSRAPSMRKHILGKSRTWACDGEYVYFRRKQANPATLERHEKFLKTGDYIHVETQDDVEVYSLQESSPFKRQTQVNLADVDDSRVRRAAVLAACRRDWPFYVDALEELAGRIKGRFHPGFAETMWSDALRYIETLIDMRGGPARLERDREIIAVRQRRGAGRGRQIIVPSRSVLTL